MVDDLSFCSVARSAGRAPPETGRPETGRPVVCIQGLGFVGSAMAVAVANARDESGTPFFDVVGVDLPRSPGAERIEAINSGQFPFASTDPELAAAFEAAYAAGNLVATSDPRAYTLASVAVTDVHLDVDRTGDEPRVDFSGFCGALRTLGARLPPGALVVVETTVPPGTCERVAAPVLRECLRERGLPADSIMLAHSYERVMPGRDYYGSIVRFWRVFAGVTAAAAGACEAFLSKVVDTRSFPLSRMGSTTASELAKVLENSYRATNIAFIEEWGRFAEQIGVDLFEVIDAIRLRPTHSNMRQPGFGVGGYCLTKDPLLAGVAARQLFEMPDLTFPFSTQAVATNERMPLVTLETVRSHLGSLDGKRLLLLGVAYRQDVGDTRFSPSEVFARAAEEAGAEVMAHDPLVRRWEELGRDLPVDLPSPDGFDAVVFAVAHEGYLALDLPAWLGASRPLVMDANRVLTGVQRSDLARIACPRASIGRGA